MRQSVYASFATREMVERATGALLDHGVRAEDISVIVYENDRDRTETDPGHNVEKMAEHGITVTTSGDAAAGAAKGAGVGLGAGALAGLVALVVPGFGLVLGGGALALAIGGMVGATAAGAVAGGVTGYLKDQGVPDDHAHEYTTGSPAACIIGVSTPSNEVSTQTVMEVLNKYGATGVRDYSTDRQPGYAAAEVPVVTESAYPSTQSSIT